MAPPSYTVRKCLDAIESVSRLLGTNHRNEPPEKSVIIAMHGEIIDAIHGNAPNGINFSIAICNTDGKRIAATFTPVENVKVYHLYQGPSIEGQSTVKDDVRQIFFPPNEKRGTPPIGPICQNIEAIIETAIDDWTREPIFLLDNWDNFHAVTKAIGFDLFSYVGEESFAIDDMFCGKRYLDCLHNGQEPTLFTMQRLPFPTILDELEIRGQRKRTGLDKVDARAIIQAAIAMGAPQTTSDPPHTVPSSTLANILSIFKRGNPARSASELTPSTVGRQNPDATPIPAPGVVPATTTGSNTTLFNPSVSERGSITEMPLTLVGPGTQTPIRRRIISGPSTTSRSASASASATATTSSAQYQYQSQQQQQQQHHQGPAAITRAAITAATAAAAATSAPTPPPKDTQQRLKRQRQNAELQQRYNDSARPTMHPEPVASSSSSSSSDDDNSDGDGDGNADTSSPPPPAAATTTAPARARAPGLATPRPSHTTRFPYSGARANGQPAWMGGTWGEAWNDPVRGERKVERRVWREEARRRQCQREGREERRRREMQGLRERREEGERSGRGRVRGACRMQ